MKTRMKQLISLLCVVTVFASTVLSTNFLSAKAETNSVETLPTDMTEITFRDFPLKMRGLSSFEDGTYTQWNYGKYEGETMDNTLFSGVITFPKEAGAYFMYAGKEYYHGIQLVTVQNTTTGEWYLRLRDSETETYLKDFTADEAGVEALVEVPLELHLSLEYIDNDGKGTENDIKLGVWFGDTLYKNEYIYINDWVDSEKIIGPYLTFIPKSGMTMESVNRMPADMTEITFEDFDIADNKYSTTFSGTYDGETMDKTLFSGKITFSEIGSTHFMFGGTKAWGGFILQDTVDSDGKPCLRLYDSNADKDNGGTKKFNDIRFYADKVGVDTFEGKELKLNYTIEYVNNDNGTKNNDVKLGVWFNGKLYNNEYIYINDYVDNGHSIGSYITVWPTEGATIDLKSCNYQLPDDMTDISFRDFGIDDIENYQGWAGKEYTGETLDNTLFSGTITFPQVAGAYLTYAGSGAQVGLGLTVEQDANQEWYLVLKHTNTTLLGELQSEKIYAETAGVEQLVGAPLELHISMEYVNLDDGETNNDLKLGLWFGDTLYKDQYIYINDYVGASRTGNYLTYSSAKTSGGAITLKSADIKMPTNLKHISFRDFGFTDGTYKSWPQGQYDGETLDGTLFSGKITISETGDTHLMYGGKIAGGGLELALDNNAADGKPGLRLRNPKGSESAATFSEIKFDSTTAGVQLVGTELDLSFSLEYVNNDGGTTNNDVKLGVWFGGKLYKNEYIYIDNYVDNSHSMGTWMLFGMLSGAEVKLESVGEINWKPLPEGMTEITFRDFGYVDGDISQYPAKQYEGETLDNTLFSGKITFPEVANAFLQYGGKEAATGFNLGTGYDADAGEWYLRLFNAKKAANETNFTEIKLYSDVAQVDALVGEEIDLNISVEFVENDGDGAKNDVKLGVWFNGKLYNNNYIYLDDYADATYSMGTFLSFSVPRTTNVHIQSVGEINWKPLPTGLTEITFRDFGYVDGDISQYPAKQYEGETLNNTLFSGKITFPEVANAFLQYGGKEAGTGFNLGTAYDADADEWYLRLFNAKKAANETNFTEVKFYSDVAEVDALVGEEIDLNFSVEFVEHDGDSAKNDVKLGVWFNGKLYNNNYIYLDNYADATYSMGTFLSFSVAKTTNVNIKSVGTINWKDVPEGLTEITFRDFGFIDGDITKYPSGEYEGDTLDNTLFTGKITFPENTSAHIMYGGKVGGGGFDIVPAQDETTGEWYLRLFDTNQDKTGRKFTEYKFYENVAGVPLVGEEVALSLSLQYVDHDKDGAKDDVKLGVWFGGKLYNNNYIYLDNFVNTGHSMGTWMAFSVSKTTKITIESVGEVDWKPLPTGFTVLGFEDFGFKAGSYEGGTKTGNCERESMDKTLFSGVVMYSTVGETHFTYGGKKGLSGLDLVNVKDEKTGEHYLRLFDTNADKKGKLFSDMYFYSDVAGVTLVGEELDLKISMEYVNHDGGKTNNDLKLGMWFGGKLYNNRYIYIDNYVDNSHSIGSYMTIWVRNEAVFNVGRISDWLDWSAFGLTANWKKTLLDTDFNLTYALAGGNPYTGDGMQIPYLAMGASLAVIVLCGCQIVRRRREDYDVQG